MIDRLNHVKATWKLAYPVILGNMSYMSVGLADTLMIGRYDAIQMAAASFVTNVFVIFLVVAMGLSYGITPLVAPAFAQRDKEGIKEWFSHAFWQAIGLGSILAAALYLATPFLALLGQEKVVVELSFPFFRVLAISFFPLILYFYGKQWAEGLSDTRHAMAVSLIGNGLNILLNWCWIYGHWGFAEMGYMGAAYATLTARLFMMLGLFSVFLFKSKFRTYLSFKWHRLRVLQQKQLIILGIPIAGQMVLEAGSFSFASIMAGWLGAEQLAAFQISMIVAGTFYMIPAGMANASTIRIGSFMGLKDQPNIRKAGFTSLLMTTALALLAGLFIVMVHRSLPGFFVSDPEIQRETMNCLLIVAGFQFSDGLNGVGLGNLRGMQDVHIPLIVVFVAFWVVGLPLGYFMAFHLHWNLYGLWTGLAIALSAGAVVLSLRFNRLSRALAEKLV